MNGKKIKLKKRGKGLLNLVRPALENIIDIGPFSYLDDYVFGKPSSVGEIVMEDEVNKDEEDEK